MKNIIITCLTAALLFAVSAGISLYLQNAGGLRGPDKDKEEAKAEEKGKAKGKEKEASSRRSEEFTPITPAQPATTSEQVTRLLSRLQDREQALIRREEDARKKEQRLEIVMEDIRAERAVLDALRKQFEAELKRLTEKDASIASKAKGLDEQKEEAKKFLDEMKKRQLDFEKGESVNITKMASLMDGMEPEKGAAILRAMADGGQKDTAVKVLALMKERKAAQLLEAMTDVTLAAELLKMLQGLKRVSGATKG